MIVLHIISSIDISSGGPSRSVPQTCLELAKLGVNVEIITQVTENPVIIPKNKKLKVSYKSINELYIFGSNLNKDRVDLIHIQHIWTPYVNVMAYWARKKNIPYLITPRGMLEPWILERNSWKKKIALFLYQSKALHKANHIHATAQLEANNIRKIGLPNPITIIPNGINLSEVKSIKSNYGSKKMIFLSRIHPKKGIELLLEAWRNINTQNWILEIAGNGDESYIKSLENSSLDLKNVKFVGSKYEESKWDFIRSADVMVLPTFSENFGIVVAEALAVGVPVLTTFGAPWKDLKTYRCGWWIDLTVEKLQTTLLSIFETSTNEFEKMGERGVDLVKKKYNIKAISKEIKSLYEKILIQ